MANAVELLDGQVNASGGIRGTNLTVYVEDSQTDPNAAQAAASDLIQNKGVQAIVGDAYAGGTLAAFPVAEAAGVVMMSPSATSAALSTVDSGDLLWRTTASDRLQGKAAASLAWTNLTYQRIGVLARNDAYGRNIASSFDENFTALGGTVPIVILYTDSATDHSAELTSLFSTNPQAVFLAAYPYDGQIILQNWWANHAAWPTRWIFTDGMEDQLTMDSLRSTGVNTTGLTGLAFSRSPTPTGVDAYERYRSSYAARFGQEPIILSENAYDAAFVLALAMQAAGSTDPSQFRSALRYVANPPGRTILPGQWAEAIAALDAGENIDYWGAANRVDFDRYGDVGTAYGVWLVNDTGVIGTAAVLDEPIFWTPAPEDALPSHVTISSPSEGALLSGVVTIRGTANASLGIVAVQVHVDGGTWQDATGTATWTFDLDTTTLTDGPHRIAARTFDGSHYSSEAAVDVMIDNSPPSVVIQGALAGAYVAASLATANWSATDLVSGIERIEVQLDASAPLVLPGTATNQSFANLAEGAHLLTVRAIDRAGNVGERSVAFIADASGPTTAFTVDGTQGDAFWFTSEVRITLAFVDSGSGIETTFIRVDQNPWQVYTTPLVLSADGVYNVSFYARDRVGNIGGSTSVRIPIDRTAPELTIDPVPPLVTHSGVTVTWTGSDRTSGIRGYEISVDGGPFESVGTATAKQLMLADGDHSIRVRASDNAGHNVTASVVVRVDTNVFSFSGPYGGAPTIALPVIIAAIALVLLWRRARLRRGGAARPGP
jgi:ABC-type branched-subunit amino acid transport system substrate-binding protein